MEALIGLLLVFAWLLFTLVWVMTFIGPARRAIARGILAPYHIPLRRFRWVLGLSAVAAFVATGIVASESPEKQSSPSASATTVASPVALVTPAPAPAASESAPAEPTPASEAAETTAPPQPLLSGGQGPAYDLAVIKAGHTVDPTDPSVAHFQEVLNVLSRSYGETPQQIADETVKAQQMLAAKGLDDSLDDIMTGMMQISTAKAHVTYEDALAGYIVLREGGAGKG